VRHLRVESELLDGLGYEQAIWVGHDWGSPVVWSLASHHPERCLGVANLCVPYLAHGFAPENVIPLVDRTIYPEADYPVGQWDYMLFYQENFEQAERAFEANIPNTVKALFRKGNAEGKRKPARTASVRKNGGWFGTAARAPEVPMDSDVISSVEFHTYVAALERTGFFGPNAWYMNPTRNVAFAAGAHNNGKLSMPVLFLHAEYDYVCETTLSRLADPMRQDCADLTEATVSAGHWMAQEQPVALLEGEQPRRQRRRVVVGLADKDDVELQPVNLATIQQLSLFIEYRAADRVRTPS